MFRSTYKVSHLYKNSANHLGVRVIKGGQNTIDMLKSNTVFAGGGGGGMRMFLKRGDRHTSIVFFLVLLIILEVAAFQQSFGRIGKSKHIDFQLKWKV